MSIARFGMFCTALQCNSHSVCLISAIWKLSKVVGAWEVISWLTRLLIADSVTHTNASVVVIILPKSTNVFQINFITMTSFD